MTKQTHTPGPWETKNGHSVIHVYGGGHRVAVVSEVPYWMDFSITDAANARLIAAAPDMLEALQAIAEGNSPFVQAVARAAIEKAVGPITQTTVHQEP